MPTGKLPYLISWSGTYETLSNIRNLFVRARSDEDGDLLLPFDESARLHDLE